MTVSKWTQRKVSISRKYDEDERQAIAFDIISYIQDRSKAGKGKDGKKFPGYTKDYRSSQEYKTIKGKKTKVDLTLSGDMLDSIDLLEDEKGGLIIGISEDDQDNGKAEGNIRGSYGKPTGKQSKARDFLAISKAEVSKILKKYPIKDEEKRKESLQSYFATIKAAKEVLGDTKKLPIGQLIISEDA